MQLRGTHFRPVCNAAGAQGFFGEGYPFHRLWKCFGLTFKNCGFLAKTTTMESRLDPAHKKGNMPLKDDGITPAEFKPASIVVRFRQGVVLNSVGLSGPGAPYLLASGRLENRRGGPFFLSFMSVQSTADDRLQELREFAALLQKFLAGFLERVGLEINFSCPNTGHDPSLLINEVGQSFDVAAALNIPLQAKLNALAPVKAVCEAAQHPACDAITMSNTIPWGQLPERIDWKGLFGTEVSPLAHLGGGGLSGWPLLPIVCDWIREARDCGFRKPIWACGGIDSRKAVQQVYGAGASGIQLGVVGILRPWRMRGIIRCANELFS